jgi:hypothetical protein
MDPVHVLVCTLQLIPTLYYYKLLFLYFEVHTFFPFKFTALFEAPSTAGQKRLLRCETEVHKGSLHVYIAFKAKGGLIRILSLKAKNTSASGMRASKTKLKRLALQPTPCL